MEIFNSLNASDSQRPNVRKKLINELLKVLNNPLFIANLEFNGGNNLKPHWLNVWKLYKRLLNNEIEYQKLLLKEYDQKSKILKSLFVEKNYMDYIGALRILCQHADTSYGVMANKLCNPLFNWSHLISHLMNDILIDQIASYSLGHIYLQIYLKSYYKSQCFDESKTYSLLFHDSDYPNISHPNSHDIHSSHSYYPWGILIPALPILSQLLLTYQDILVNGETAQIPFVPLDQIITVVDNTKQSLVKINNCGVGFKVSTFKRRIIYIAQTMGRLLIIATNFDPPSSRDISKKFRYFYDASTTMAKLPIITSVHDMIEFVCRFIVVILRQCYTYTRDQLGYDNSYLMEILLPPINSYLESRFLDVRNRLRTLSLHALPLICDIVTCTISHTNNISNILPIEGALSLCERVEHVSKASYLMGIVGRILDPSGEKYVLAYWNSFKSRDQSILSSQALARLLFNLIDILVAVSGPCQISHNPVGLTKTSNVNNDGLIEIVRRCHRVALSYVTVFCLTPPSYDNTESEHNHRLGERKLKLTHGLRLSNYIRCYDQVCLVIKNIRTFLDKCSNHTMLETGQNVDYNKELKWHVALTKLASTLYGYHKSIVGVGQMGCLLKLIEMYVDDLDIPNFSSFPLESWIDAFDSFIPLVTTVQDGDLTKTLFPLIVQSCGILASKLTKLLVNNITNYELAIHSIRYKLSQLANKIVIYLKTGEVLAYADHVFDFMVVIVLHFRSTIQFYDEGSIDLSVEVNKFLQLAWGVVLNPQTFYFGIPKYYSLCYVLLSSDTIFPPPLTCLDVERQSYSLNSDDFDFGSFGNLKCKIIRNIFRNYVSSSILTDKSVDPSKRNGEKDEHGNGQKNEKENFGKKCNFDTLFINRDFNDDLMERGKDIIKLLARLTLDYRIVEGVMEEKLLYGNCKVNLMSGYNKKMYRVGPINYDKYGRVVLNKLNQYDYQGMSDTLYTMNLQSDLSIYEEGKYLTIPDNAINEALFHDVMVNIPTVLLERQLSHATVSDTMVDLRWIYLCLETIRHTDSNGSQGLQIGETVQKLTVKVADNMNNIFNAAPTSLLTLVQYSSLIKMLTCMLDLISYCMAYTHELGSSSCTSIIPTFQSLESVLIDHYDRGEAAFYFHYKHMLPDSSLDDKQWSIHANSVKSSALIEDSHPTLADLGTEADNCNTADSPYRKILCLKIFQLRTSLDFLKRSHNLMQRGAAGRNDEMSSSYHLISDLFGDNDINDGTGTAKIYVSWFIIAAIIYVIDQLSSTQAMIPDRKADILDGDTDYKIAIFEALKVAIHYNLNTSDSLKIRALLVGLGRCVSYLNGCTKRSPDVQNLDHTNDSSLLKESSNYYNVRCYDDNVPFLDMIQKVIVTLCDMWKDELRHNDTQPYHAENGIDQYFEDTGFDKIATTSNNKSKVAIFCRHVKMEFINLFWEFLTHFPNSFFLPPSLGDRCKLNFDKGSKPVRISLMESLFELTILDKDVLVRYYFNTHIRRMITTRQHYQYPTSQHIYSEQHQTKFGDFAIKSMLVSYTINYDVQRNKDHRETLIHSDLQILAILYGGCVTNRIISINNLTLYFYRNQLPMELFQRFIDKLVPQAHMTCFIIPTLIAWLSASYPLIQFPYNYFGCGDAQSLAKHYYPTILYLSWKVPSYHINVSLLRNHLMPLLSTVAMIDDWDCLESFGTEVYHVIVERYIRIMSATKSRPPTYSQPVSVSHGDRTIMRKKKVYQHLNVPLISLVLKFLQLKWTDGVLDLADNSDSFDTLNFVCLCDALKHLMLEPKLPLELQYFCEIFGSQPLKVYEELLDIREDLVTSITDQRSDRYYTNYVGNYQTYGIWVKYVTLFALAFIFNTKSPPKQKATIIISPSPAVSISSNRTIVVKLLFVKEFSLIIPSLLIKFLFLYGDCPTITNINSHDKIMMVQLCQVLNVFTGQLIDIIHDGLGAPAIVMSLIREFFIRLNDIFFILEIILRLRENDGHEIELPVFNDPYFNKVHIRYLSNVNFEIRDTSQKCVSNLVKSAPYLKLFQITPDDTLNPNIRWVDLASELGYKEMWPSYLLKFKYYLRWRNGIDQQGVEKEATRAVYNKLCLILGPKYLSLISDCSKDDNFSRDVKSLAISALAELTPLIPKLEETLYIYGCYRNDLAGACLLNLETALYNDGPFAIRYPTHLKHIFRTIRQVIRWDSTKANKSLDNLSLRLTEKSTLIPIVRELVNFEIMRPLDKMDAYNQQYLNDVINHLTDFYHSLNLYFSPQTVTKSLSYPKEMLIQLCYRMTAKYLNNDNGSPFQSYIKLMCPLLMKSFDLCQIILPHILKELMDPRDSKTIHNNFIAITNILKLFINVVVQNQNAYGGNNKGCAKVFVGTTPSNKNLHDVILCFINFLMFYISDTFQTNYDNRNALPSETTFAFINLLSVASNLAYNCQRYYPSIYFIEYVLNHLKSTNDDDTDMSINWKEFFDLYLQSYLRLNMTDPLYAYVSKFPECTEERLAIYRLEEKWDKCLSTYETTLKCLKHEPSSQASIMSKLVYDLRKSNFDHLSSALDPSSQSRYNNLSSISTQLTSWDLDHTSNTLSPLSDVCYCNEENSNTANSSCLENKFKHCISLFKFNRHRHFKKAKEGFVKSVCHSLNFQFIRKEHCDTVNQMLCRLSLVDVLGKMDENYFDKSNFSSIDRVPNISTWPNTLDIYNYERFLSLPILNNLGSNIHIIGDKIDHYKTCYELKNDFKIYFHNLSKMCFHSALSCRMYSNAQDILNCTKNYLLDGKSSIPQIYSYNEHEIDRAKLVWAYGERGYGISILKSIISGITGHYNNSKMVELTKTEYTTLLPPILTLCGDWLSESGSEFPVTIYKDYYERAIKMESSARVNYSLGRFTDTQYQFLSKHMKSDIFERKLELTKEYTARVEEVKRMGLAPNRYLMTVEKQNALDLDEINKVKADHQIYLARCLTCYFDCLIESNQYDFKIYRIVSLWFENCHTSHVNALVATKSRVLPRHKWLPLIYQILARLSTPIEDVSSPLPSSLVENVHLISNDHHTCTFDRTLFDLVTRIATQHPRSVLYPLLALKNAHVDLIYEKLKYSSTTIAKMISKDGDTGVIGRGDMSDKSRSSAMVLDRMIECKPVLKRLLERTEEFCLALIEFAYYKIPDTIKKETAGSTDCYLKTFPIPTHTLLSKLVYDNDEYVEDHLYLPIFLDDGPSSYVTKFEPTFQLAGGVNLPKILRCTSEDGIRRRILLKGQDDLRQDAVMQQIFRLVNHLLSETGVNSPNTMLKAEEINCQQPSSQSPLSHSTQSTNDDDRRSFNHVSNKTQVSKLKLETYKVLPLSQKSGILEWCDGTIPLGHYLVGQTRDETLGAHHRYRSQKGGGDYTAMRCRKIMTAAFDKLEAYQDVCQHFLPVFRYFFFENYTDPIDWHIKRSNYVNSVATSSMVGYVLGLGDRHVHNILVKKDSGTVVHIDLGVAFEQGKLLPTPETVPFRLTRDIVDGMGVFGVEGSFKKNCERIMKMLRDSQKSLLTVAQVLLYDPLYSWSLSPSQMMLKQNKVVVCNTESHNQETNRPSDRRYDTRVGKNVVNDNGFSKRKRLKGSFNTPSSPKLDSLSGLKAAKRVNNKNETGSNEKLSFKLEDANKLAERVLLRMEQKLMGMEEGHLFNVEDQVNHLIREASDPNNLSRLFPGWQPYI